MKFGPVATTRDDHSVVSEPSDDLETSDEAASTVVLLGAGASADAGLPSAAQLHVELVEHLPPLYANLARLVFGDGAVDVERLFRVIEFVHAVETQGRPEGGPSRHELLDVARLVGEWTPLLADYLDAQRTTVRGAPTATLIEQLYEHLLRLLWLGPMNGSNLVYLRQVLDAMRGGTVVTLNYDNTVERAAILGAACPLDHSPVPRDRSRPSPGFDNWVRLVKLHGSLNWKLDPQTGDVDIVDDVDVWRDALVGQSMGQLTHVPGVIFGAGNKLRAAGPYLDLYSEFRIALNEARRLIVIGYSFSDDHVNELLRRWVQRQPARDRVMRVSRLDDKRAPDVVDGWFSFRRNVALQVVTGRASERIDELLRPTPNLLR